MAEKHNLSSQPYLSMTREDLDYHYSPSRWSHRMNAEEVVDAHVKLLTEGSTKAREAFEGQLAEQYGPKELQKLDILAPKSLPKDCPILIYIHGGYWQQLSREMSTFLAGPVINHGGAVVAVGYDLAPEASMDEMVSHVKAAVKHVILWAMDRGSRGVYVSGHSAGGHLAAMMLGVDWGQEIPGASHPLKGACLISGVFDLRPIPLTYVNDPINMTPEIAWANSPFNHVEDVTKAVGHAKVIVAVGQHDPPEFRRQSKEYETALRNNGVLSELLDVPDVDHFNVLERLMEEKYELTKAILELMGLL